MFFFIKLNYCVSKRKAKRASLRAKIEMLFLSLYSHKKMTTIIITNDTWLSVESLTHYDNLLLMKLDQGTQIALAALWRETVSDTLRVHYAEEIEEEVNAIRATE